MKNEIRPRRSKAAATTTSSPGSPARSSARIAAASSAPSSASSASRRAQTAIARAPLGPARSESAAGTSTASPSATLATYRTGFAVSGWRSRKASGASAGGGRSRAGLPAPSASINSRSQASSATAARSWDFASLATRSSRRSACSRSAYRSSVSTASASATGSTRPSGWGTFGSSCARTTCRMASVSLMLARKRLPSPSPVCAPRTRPAMSWNSIVSCTTGEAPTTSATRSRRSSGTGTTATFGSTVVNGYPATSAPALVRALNSVDFPALGSPTMPIFTGRARPPPARAPRRPGCRTGSARRDTGGRARAGSW